MIQVFNDISIVKTQEQKEISNELFTDKRSNILKHQKNFQKNKNKIILLFKRIKRVQIHNRLFYEQPQVILKTACSKTQQPVGTNAAFLLLWRWSHVLSLRAPCRFPSSGKVWEITLTTQQSLQVYNAHSPNTYARVLFSWVDILICLSHKLEEL